MKKIPFQKSLVLFVTTLATLSLSSAAQAGGTTLTLTPRASPTMTLIPRAISLGAPPTARFLVPPAPNTAAREEQAGEARLEVELEGSFGRLPAATVTLRSGGSVVAEGVAFDELTVPAVDDLELELRATGLVDQPTLRQAVSLAPGGHVTVLPVSMETGLVRAEATLGGRRVSGLVRFYRLDAATGAAANAACGSMGATGSSREISTGRYRAELTTGGVTLSQVVEVVPGSSRLVRLQG